MMSDRIVYFSLGGDVFELAFGGDRGTWLAAVPACPNCGRSLIRDDAPRLSSSPRCHEHGAAVCRPWDRSGRPGRSAFVASAGAVIVSCDECRWAQPCDDEAPPAPPVSRYFLNDVGTLYRTDGRTLETWLDRWFTSVQPIEVVDRWRPVSRVYAAWWLVAQRWRLWRFRRMLA